VAPPAPRCYAPLQPRDETKEIRVSLYGFGAFCAVYLLAVATPGPGVTALLARSLAHGMRGAPAYIAGFLIGDLTWFIGAAAGLAALAHTAQALFLVIRYAGALFLLYLAYRLWTAPATPIEKGAVPPAQSASGAFLASLMLTLGNPKPMLFFIALLPAVVHMQELRLPDYALIAGAICVILPAVLAAYALAASRARGFFRNRQALRYLNRGAALALSGAAAAVVNH
jgi:threonine/homoserine/homoserine lactone efflux protein